MSTTVGTVDPSEPTLVKYFPNFIPLMLAIESSHITIMDIASTSHLFSARSGRPIIYVTFIERNVRNEANQNSNAVQCIQLTKNAYFVPNAIFTQSFSPPSVGYDDAISAHIRACGTKKMNIRIIHIGIAPRPRYESDTDLAIQRIPYNADTFISTNSHNPIFFFPINSSFHDPNRPGFLRPVWWYYMSSFYSPFLGTFTSYSLWNTCSPLIEASMKPVM